MSALFPTPLVSDDRACAATWHLLIEDISGVERRMVPSDVWRESDATFVLFVPLGLLRRWKRDRNVATNQE